MANIDIDSLQSFSARDLLKLTEYRIAQILAAAQSYDNNGKRAAHAELDPLYKRRDELKAEVAAEDAGPNGSGNVLVGFGEPQ